MNSFTQDEQISFLKMIDGDIPESLHSQVRQMQISYSILIQNNLYQTLYLSLSTYDNDQVYDILEAFSACPPVSKFQVQFILDLVPSPLNNLDTISSFLNESWLDAFPEQSLNLISKLSDNYLLQEEKFFVGAIHSEKYLFKFPLQALTALCFLAYEGRGFDYFCRISQKAIKLLFSTKCLIITKVFNFLTAVIFSFQNFEEELVELFNLWNFLPCVAASLQLAKKDLEAASALCECVKSVIEVSEAEHNRFMEVGFEMIEQLKNVQGLDEDENYEDLVLMV